MLRAARRRPVPRLAALPLTGLLVLAACSSGAPPAAVPSASAPPPASSPPAAAPPAGDEAEARVAAMSLEQQIGSLLLPQVYGSSATEVTADQAEANLALLGVRTPAEAVARYSLAGVTLLERNTTDPRFGALPTGNADSPKQLRALTDGLTAAARAAGDDLPLVIALDQEGGTVARLRAPATELPAALAVGATGDPDLARQQGATLGAELRAVGVTVDLAPVADLASLPTNRVIGTRSFGADPAAVARLTAATVTGLQDTGVAATLKHFPGHGGTDVDSHLALPTLPQSPAELTARDLAPFRAGLDAGAKLVMTGHLRVPAYDDELPSSLSPRLVDGLLRGELGYDGVVVTDGLGMEAIRARFDAGEAAVRAVLAGDDLLSLSANTRQARDALLAAVRSGRLPAERVRAAAVRVTRLRMSLPAAPGDLSVVGSAGLQATARRVAAASVTALGCVRPIPAAVQVVGSPTSARAALEEALGRRGVAGGSGPPVVVVGSEDTSAVRWNAPAAVVGVGTPYVLAGARAPAVLAAYGTEPASLEAVADVLTGRAPARGQLPVPLASRAASCR